MAAVLSIGLGEIVLVAVVALVVLKPEDIPGLARQAGVLWAQVKMNWQGMKAGFLEGIEDNSIRGKKRD